MTSRRPTREPIDAVHRYFSREFPGSMQLSWWEGETRRQIFEIEHGAVRWRIVMDGSMFWDCPDCAGALCRSNLADAMRAVCSRTRFFYLTWEAGVLHIRSMPL